MSNSQNRRWALGLGILSLALHGFVWQGQAQAQQTLDISLSIDGTTAGAWAPAIIDTGTNYTINNVSYTVPGATLYFHDMSVDPDPSISASVDVINNTLSVQNYTLIFTLPVSPIAGSSRMAGSVQGGTTDVNGDGAILSTLAGAPLYYGQIDGANVLSLFPDPKTITASAFNSASDSTSAGLPGVTIPGPGVLGSIGIEHQFSLTPGDRATFTSVFVVNAPEPGSLSLLAIGGLVLLYCRRR